MDKDKKIDSLFKTLHLMQRMRLFPNDRFESPFKFKIEIPTNDILEEGVHQSYNARNIYKILLKYYDISPEENFMPNGNNLGVVFSSYVDGEGYLVNTEILTISIIMPKNFKDEFKIKKFMETCGWTCAGSVIYEENENYNVFVFEKNKQVETIYIPEFLYHLTPTNKLSKIFKNGLVPKSNSKVSKHPERIYFLTNELSDSYYKMFVNQLYKTQLEKTLNLSGLSKSEIKEKLNEPRKIEYSLLQIRTDLCLNLKLYGDPNMEGAGWTYNNIPPQAIKVIKNNI